MKKVHCYRHLAEDKMAETLADEVIRSATDFDGTERAPMRLAEASVPRLKSGIYILPVSPGSLRRSWSR